MTTPDPAPLPLALRTREAAAALGISERMLQELASSGDVPVVKVGRANLFPVRELQDWLSSKICTSSHSSQGGDK